MQIGDEWEELFPSSGGDSNVGFGVPTRRRSSFSYYRLPDSLLKLSVLKLDGSSFDVQVARTASVLGLKLAVEDVFRDHPEKGGGRISWSHVWGHFCLCYEGYKLVDDRASLKSFGIKDGDQICFIRHLSINSSPTRRHPKNYKADLEPHDMPSTRTEALAELEENSSDDKNDDDKASTSQSSDEQCHSVGADGDDDHVLGHREFKLANFWRGWLSYSRLQSSSRRMRLDNSIQPPRSSMNCLRVRSMEEEH